MWLMRTFVVMIALAGCNHHDAAVDAAVPRDAVPDAPPVALDCPSYCAEMDAHCTGANAQYSDAAHCSSACKSFTVGASQITDRTGNTLGCRIYYAGVPSMTDPGTHCVHAGPGGDLFSASPPAFCAGDDVCVSFCTLEIMACGTEMDPLPGMPLDGNNNPLYQYQDMADCMFWCGKFDKTHVYSTTAVGDSLACRMLHATEASIAVKPDGATHCYETSPFSERVCSGTAMP